MKPGSLVQLRGGGQIMTIERIRDGGYITCVWFDGHGDFCREEICSEALEIVVMEEA